MTITEIRKSLLMHMVETGYDEWFVQIQVPSLSVKIFNMQKAFPNHDHIKTAKEALTKAYNEQNS